MSNLKSNVSRPAWLPSTVRGAAIFALLLMLAACGKDEPAAESSAAGAPSANSESATPAQPAKPAQAVSDEVAAMGADELREAAGTALREQRLYAPGGNNAMEYYLALRDKQPNDPAVASALTDLMPYTLIATEQSIVREDFDEAERLYALMVKADAQAPALPRLKQSIADARAQATRQAAAEEERSAEAEQRAQELAEQRIQEQQQAQEQAAAQLAAQQAQEAAAKQAAERAAAQREAAAQQAAAETDAPANEEPASSGPSNTKLVVVSTVKPEFPRQALRRRQSGEVQVEFVVGTNGSVTSARVVSSNPRQVFDNAALHAVKQWKFKPMSEPKTVRQTLSFSPGG